MSFLFNRERRIPKNATFRLTPEGQEKLQGFEGGDQMMVLIALETGGSASLDELSRTTRMSTRKLERILSVLIRHGYIAPVGYVGALERGY